MDNNNPRSFKKSDFLRFKQFTIIVCLFLSVQNLPPFCDPISFKTLLLDQFLNKKNMKSV